MFGDIKHNIKPMVDSLKSKLLLEQAARLKQEGKTIEEIRQILGLIPSLAEQKMPPPVSKQSTKKG